MWMYPRLYVHLVPLGSDYPEAWDANTDGAPSSDPLV